MLHFIRERAQGWIAWFIVGLISIPFALWGVNSYLGGPSDVIVAEVNGDPISQVEYQRALQMQRDRMRNVMGDQFNPDIFDNVQMKRSVLDGIIDEKLLAAASLDLGQTVSDRDLAQIIHSTPAFQKDGQFDPEQYKAVLIRAGLSPAGYEFDLRNNMFNQEFVTNVQQSTIVTESTINNVVRLEKQQRDIAYGVVAAQAQLADIVIDQDNIRLYFEANKQQYTAPEQVSVEYVDLSVDELKKSIEVDETTLKSFYADNQDQFVGPEQRRVSHILIEGDDEAALKTISDLKSRIDAGESFADVASESSQDIGSAENGGDLGFIQKGVMDDTFEAAVFELVAVEDVSEPVKTEFGYHLIQLTDLQAPQGKSFSQAKQDVESLYKQREAEAAFYEKAEQLADLSYESPDSLDLTAETLELEIKTSQSFTRTGGSGIASDKKVINAAFSEDVLDNELNSSVIELSKNRFIVLRKNKFIDETLLPFDSVAPAIEESLRFEKAREKAKQIGEEYLVQIEQGESAESLFSSNWQSTQTYSRSNDKVSAQILNHAFAAPKPTQDTPSYSGFVADNGNYIVIQLTAVEDGDVAAVESEQREALEGHLKRIATESELQALLASIKESAEIEIFEQNL